MKRFVSTEIVAYLQALDEALICAVEIIVIGEPVRLRNNFLALIERIFPAELHKAERLVRE